MNIDRIGMVLLSVTFLIAGFNFRGWLAGGMDATNISLIGSFVASFAGGVTLCVVFWPRR